MNGAETSEVQKKRQIDLSLLRTEKGINVSIDSLVVGQNNLTGDAVLSGEDRVRVDLQLSGGHIVLSDLVEVETLSPQRASALDRTARVGTEMVGKVVSSPSRIMHREDRIDKNEALPESDRIFSTAPLEISILSAVDVSVKGRLDSMITPWAKLNSLQLDVGLEAGRIDAFFISDDISGGQGQAKFYFDTTPEVPIADLEATLIGVGNYPESEAARKSTFVDFRSSGSSFAELAAGLNGSLYVEFGPGQLDYQGISFLTQNITSSMVKSLIPGAEREVPQMICGITWAEVHDGVGTTPFGYAVQTGKANLLGKLLVNLVDEQLVAEFDSKSRKLRGLSVGDMFSKAISVEGSLRNPKIVAKKGSLAWRGWAAISTGGLSMIGEGMIGQVLSGDDPCGAVKEKVQETYCGKEPVQSALVCPGFLE